MAVFLKHSNRMKTMALLFLLAVAVNPAKNIVGQFSAAEMDIYGNVYAVDKELNMVKIKHDSTTGRKFSLANYGNSPMIDASNPLEIFVYFGSTGNMLVLDNQLNIQNTLNLFQTRFMQPLGFGRSNDGNIWILDNTTTTLKKLDRQGNLLLESVQINNLEPSAHVRRIYDNGQYIFTQDGADNVRVFNQNMVLIYQYSTKEIIGLNSDRFYYKSGGFVFSSYTGEMNQYRADTVCAVSDTAQVIRADKSHILSITKAGLTLQNR